MLKIALIFGGIAGSITIGVMTLGIMMAESPGHGSSSQAVGYLIMLVALSLIFVGVKRYRDQELGGTIKFGPALLLGLSIVGVAGIMYVLGWEVYLASTDYAFAQQYADSILAAKEQAGASAEEIEKTAASMKSFVDMYANPFIRLPITFSEIFPVGLIIALISAALLRNPKVLPARG